jgi:4-hydroxyphenylacetate 3-monooxygenase
MPARTGAQYIEGLRGQPREVWIEGECVGDVTVHPAFRRGARSVAALYDMQCEPALQDEMTYASPTTGERVGLSFMTPRTMAELERRRRMMARWARSSGGMLGRSPDYLNASLMALAAASDYMAQGRPEFGDNIRRYYEHVRENDLALTHTLVNLRRNRSPSATIGTDEETALRVVKETDAGIVVRGARVLATLGPISDEIMVFPSTVLKAAQGADPFSFAFSIPCGTSGLKFVCRESFDLGRSRFDHPLGSRFEEMDAIVIFDDVLVPWERVFLLGDVELCNNVFAATNAVVHMMHQVVIKNVAKSEFVLGLALLVVETLGSGQLPNVQGLVAELIMDTEVMKACLRAAEADASLDGWGVMCPNRPPLDVARNLYPRMYPRMVEIIQVLGSSSLMAIPSSADFDADIAPDLERYLATDTATGRERVQLFRLAWDVACSAFGSRQALYERFFFGDPVRMASALYSIYDKAPLMERVKQFLKEDVDGT